MSIHAWRLDRTGTQKASPSRTVALWLFTGLVGVLLCLQELPGTFAHGQFFPADHDSYYHATRVEVAFREGGGVQQFDPRLHAPEGSWVPWPWGYDSLLLAIARIGTSLSNAEQPMSILAFVAPVWLLLNQALLLGIARQLGLGMGLQGLLLAFNALLLVNRGLHRVGMIDHHFVEYSFVLATLWVGLRWTKRCAGRRDAALLGAVLGASSLFHNSMFVLQLPVLLTLGLAWLGGRAPPWQAAAAFATALLAVTFFGLLPSEPFRAGVFNFYLHSSFQLYVAAASGTMAVLLSLLPRQLTMGLLMAVGAGLLSLPLLQQLEGGGQFLTAEFYQLAEMGETRSPLAMIAAGDLATVVELYSGLVILLPVSMLLLGWITWKCRGSASTFLLVYAVFGTALLLFQYRLAYFGTFVLLIPWCLLAQHLANNTKPAFRHFPLSGLALLVALALWPSYRSPGPRTTILSGDVNLVTGLVHFANLREACVANPGTVLADNNDGHYITFFSACSVIANNFIISRKDEAKLSELEALMRGNVDSLLEERPDVRYILVRRADPHIYRGMQQCGANCEENAGLRSQLLFSDEVPAKLTLISETRSPADGVPVPSIRLFERSGP